MASRPKKRRADVEDCEDSGSSGEGSGEEGSGDEGCGDSDSSSVDPELEIEVDFEARAIEEDDFHGIRRLLQQVFLKASVDLSGLTALITAQKDIGSTIKVNQEEEEEEEKEEDVYGVATVLSLSQSKDSPCVQGLVSFLLSQCQSHAPSLHPRLAQLLTDGSSSVGLLVNERFLNIPPAIAPPLLRSLVSEVKQGCEKVARSHEITVAKPTAGKKRRRKRQANGDRASVNSQVFDSYENEILQKEASLSFSYPVEGEGGDSVLGGKWSFDDTAMKPWRTVMVLSASKLEHCLTELERSLKT